MPYVGQLVGPQGDPKQTWLLDNVLVRGIAQQQGGTTGFWLPPGADVGADDAFFLLPDENYRHLTAMFPGNKIYYSANLSQQDIGCILLETYPISNAQINNGLHGGSPRIGSPTARAFLSARHIRDARAPYEA